MDLNSKFVLMKTFKIQPRNMEGQSSSFHSNAHTDETTIKRKMQTPTREKGKLPTSAFNHDHKTGSSKSSSVNKSFRQRNKSMDENMHTLEMYSLRLAVSEFSAFLDNEIFRVRTEADLQKHEIMTLFEELYQRLARKLNYLQNYVEQQVTSVMEQLTTEKEKIDQAIVCVDSFLESNAENTSAVDVQVLREAIECDFKGIPSSISVPQIIDPHELIDNFTALIEGHICRQEIAVDRESCLRFCESTATSNVHSRGDFDHTVLQANMNILNKRTNVKDLSTDLFSKGSTHLSGLQSEFDVNPKMKQQSYDGYSFDQRLQANQGNSLVDKPKYSTKDTVENSLRQKSRSSAKLKSNSKLSEQCLDDDSYRSKSQKETGTGLKFSIDLECYETMEAILPQPILHIDEQDENED